MRNKTWPSFREENTSRLTAQIPSIFHFGWRFDDVTIPIDRIVIHFKCRMQWNTLPQPLDPNVYCIHVQTTQRNRLKFTLRKCLPPQNIDINPPTSSLRRRPIHYKTCLHHSLHPWMKFLAALGSCRSVRQGPAVKDTSLVSHQQPTSL